MNSNWKILEGFKKKKKTYKNKNVFYGTIWCTVLKQDSIHSSSKNLNVSSDNKIKSVLCSPAQSGSISSFNFYLSLIQCSNQRYSYTQHLMPYASTNLVLPPSLQIHTQPREKQVKMSQDIIFITDKAD